MRFGTILGGIAAAGCLAFAGAASAATYVATYTGIVDGGYDIAGVFGAPGDISGKQFTATFTYDPAVGTVSAISGGEKAVGAITSATLTIGSGTYSFNFDAFNLLQTGSLWGGYVFHSAKSSTPGGTTELTLAGGAAGAPTSVSQTAGPLSIVDPFTQGPAAFNGYFGIEGPGGATRAYGDLQPASFTVTAVPEPATWAMMIAGFGLAGAMLRRRTLVAAKVFA